MIPHALKLPSPEQLRHANAALHREIARRKDAQGFTDNRKAAKEGGAIAGNARKALEAKTGKPVVSKANYLPLPATAKVLDEADAPATPAKSKAATGRKPKGKKT